MLMWSPRFRDYPVADEGYQTRINRVLREDVEGQARGKRRTGRA
jgi:hypothetical protein